VSGCPKGSVCAGFLVKMFVPAVGLAPAVGFSEHSSAGTFSCTNAKAGTAIAPSINAETASAAKTLFTLLKTWTSLLLCSLRWYIRKLTSDGCPRALAVGNF
jgi:hypothetical protein